jgi:hypothetical protein
MSISSSVSDVNPVQSSSHQSDLESVPISSDICSAPSGDVIVKVDISSDCLPPSTSETNPTKSNRTNTSTIRTFYTTIPYLVILSFCPIVLLISAYWNITATSRSIFQPPSDYFSKGFKIFDFFISSYLVAFFGGLLSFILSIVAFSSLVHSAFFSKYSIYYSKLSASCSLFSGFFILIGMLFLSIDFNDNHATPLNYYFATTQYVIAGVAAETSASLVWIIQSSIES